MLAVRLVVGASLALLTTWLLQKTSKPEKDPKANAAVTPTTTTTTITTLPAEIRQEQLSRHTLYFEATGMQRLQQARVCVVGLGGVGSHTAVMLARAGLGYLRLVDFDQVTLSSLNRHACATLADVGTPKATCLQQHLRRICPDPQYLQLDARVAMYTAESGPGLLELPTSDGVGNNNETRRQQQQQQQQQQQWDLVIDAIDDVPTKAALLAHCITHKIRVISCMGAAGKSDFTRLHCSDLRAAAKDPLATKLRQSLKQLLLKVDDVREHDYLDDMDVLTVLYCSEKTVVKLADFTPEQKAQGVHHFGAVDGMRIRVLPVLGTMPAIMGQSLATMALTEIGRKPILQPLAGERVGKNVRNKLYQHLRNREQKICQQVLSQAGLAVMPNEEQEGCFVEVPAAAPSFAKNDAKCTKLLPGRTWVGPLQVDSDDIDYLMQVWRNRCGVSGARLGTVLNLVRWDLSKPSTCNNLVLMSVGAMQRFDQDGTEGLSALVRQRIEARLASTFVDSFGEDSLL